MTNSLSFAAPTIVGVDGDHAARRIHIYSRAPTTPWYRRVIDHLAWPLVSRRADEEPTSTSRGGRSAPCRVTLRAPSTKISHLRSGFDPGTSAGSVRGLSLKAGLQISVIDDDGVLLLDAVPVGAELGRRDGECRMSTLVAVECGNGIADRRSV